MVGQASAISSAYQGTTIKGDRMKKLALLALMLVLWLSPTLRSSERFAFADVPVLYFSDLTSGPSTGWEGSSSKGAAVTVWGKNFGSMRGNSWITINGAQLISDSDYAEWGEIGPARGLERITFWLNSNCQDGAGTISVTINGITSNTLPFTVREGNIYFIAKDGDDTNNGKYASHQGGGNGPWEHFYMSKGHDSQGFGNSILSDGDIVYVRTGTYDDIDQENRMIYYRGINYSPGSPLAVVGYPGEWPVLGTTVRKGVYMYFGYGSSSYLEWHKLTWRNAQYAFQINGHHIRIVGCKFENSTDGVWAGVIHIGNTYSSKFYGLYFNNCGYDYYKHIIYIQCQSAWYDSYDIDIGWWEMTNFYDNGVTGRGCPAINIRSASSYKVHDVRIHDIYMHDGDYGTLYYQEVPSNEVHDIWIYNNIVENCGHIADGSVSGQMYIQYNRDDSNKDTFYIYNNTFYNCGSSSLGISLGLRAVGYAHVNCKNNIWYSTNSVPYHYKGSNCVVNSDNDIYYGNGSPPSGTGWNYIQTIESNPVFVDMDNDDYRLRANSPAIDAGTTDVSPFVTTDYSGNSRPKYDGYDIGAYEYSVYPPSDLRIQQ